MSAELDSFELLKPEHELLGASFVHDEALGVDLPASYGDAEAECAALAEGVGVADLSGLLALLVSGSDAPALVSAACAGEALGVGECGLSAVLTGDGAFASAPLVARTGDAEYLLWDLSARADLLAAWLNFLAGIEEQGRAPFAAAGVEDVSESLVPLLVAGPGAEAVLRDYNARELPGAGEVASIPLDAIQCLVAGLPEAVGPGWLVFVGPQYARVLWRSLLSFTQVAPVGREALALYLREKLSWWPLMETTEHAVASRYYLRSWGLIRENDGFVGARALN